MTIPNRLSRRTALRTISTFAGATTVAATGVGAASGVESGDAASRYVGVVDRIVDGRHVVLLLEEDNRVVDQLVLDVDEFDRAQERDILVVVLKDGELYRYRHLPEKPASTGRNR